jgi:hypothetical protein
MDILTASTLAILTIYGPARVIDGDTVVVNQTHVRLKGVDAAEMNTNLGKHSKQVMISIVGTGNKLTCYLTGEKTYKRDVGYCFTEAHVDINQEIIARGAALACPHYDTRYVQFETEEAIANQQRARYCGTPARRTKSIPAAAPTAPDESAVLPPPPVINYKPAPQPDIHPTRMGPNARAIAQAKKDKAAYDEAHKTWHGWFSDNVLFYGGLATLFMLVCLFPKTMGFLFLVFFGASRGRERGLGPNF